MRTTKLIIYLLLFSVAAVAQQRGNICLATPDTRQYETAHNELAEFLKTIPLRYNQRFSDNVARVSEIRTNAASSEPLQRLVINNIRYVVFDEYTIVNGRTICNIYIGIVHEGRVSRTMLFLDDIPYLSPGNFKMLLEQRYRSDFTDLFNNGLRPHPLTLADIDEATQHERVRDKLMQRIAEDYELAYYYRVNPSDTRTINDESLEPYINGRRDQGSRIKLNLTCPGHSSVEHSVNVSRSHSNEWYEFIDKIKNNLLK